CEKSSRPSRHSGPNFSVSSIRAVTLPQPSSHRYVLGLRTYPIGSRAIMEARISRPPCPDHTRRRGCVQGAVVAAADYLQTSVLPRALTEQWAAGAAVKK